MIIKVCLLASSMLLASSTASAFQFSSAAGCERDVAKSLGAVMYGEDKDEKFDSYDFGTLCEGTTAELAVACVSTVVASRKLMRPMGLAAVCNGGTSGREALRCLAFLEDRVDSWVTAVDGCGGMARQASVCLSSEAGLTCNSKNFQRRAVPSDGAGTVR